MMPVPLSWQKPLPNACNVCAYGRGPRDQRLCACPDVAGRNREVPSAPARDLAGQCGPDARFLAFEGQPLT